MKFSSTTGACIMALFALVSASEDVALKKRCSKHSTLTTSTTGYYNGTTTHYYNGTTATTTTYTNIYYNSSSTTTTTVDATTTTIDTTLPDPYGSTTTTPVVDPYGTDTTSTTCTKSSTSTTTAKCTKSATPLPYGTTSKSSTYAAYGTTTKYATPLGYPGYSTTKKYTTASPAKSSTSVYYAQHGSVKTIQTCTTEYCGLKPAHVPTSVATIHMSSTVKVTKTTTSTCHVTLNDKTKNLTRTLTTTCTRTAKAIANVVYSTHVVKVTKSYTVSTVKTVTTTLPAKTVKQYGTLIPTPAGFVNVAEDPDNDASTYPKPQEKRDVEKRDYVYNAPAARYVTAVKCTKSLQTIATHTYTVLAKSKVTLTAYGKTVTVTKTKDITKTIAPGYVKPTTIARTSTSTVTSTCTKTSTSTVTKQYTSVIPGPTTYAACGASNIFNGPTGSVGAMVGVEQEEIPNVSTPEACCAKCQVHVNTYGAKDCVGSFFTNEDGQFTCMLKLSSTCSSSTTGLFVPYPDDEDFEGYVSNGPCGRWKVLKGAGDVPAAGTTY